MKLGRGNHLPNEDHVVRHVPVPKTRRDSSGKILGLLPTALERRVDEEYLSVSHLEHFSGTRAQQMKQVKASITAAKKSNHLGPSGLFAIANVAEIKAAAGVLKSNRKIRISFLPTHNDPSHSGIYEISEEDSELMDLLVDEVFANTVQVGKV